MSSLIPKLTPTRRTKGVKRDRTLSQENTNPDSSSLRGPRFRKKVPVPGELRVEVFTPADMTGNAYRQGGGTGGTDSPSNSRSSSNSPTPRRAPSLPASTLRNLSSRSELPCSSPPSRLFSDNFPPSRPPSFNPSPRPSSPLNPNIWANTMTSSPPESPLHVGVPVTWSADDFEPEIMEEVLVEIIDFVRERGFKSIAHVHQSLHTFSSKWAGGSRCYAEVENDWNHGLPELLKEITPRRKVKGQREVTEFDHAVVDVASEVLAKEVRSFTSVKDTRPSVHGVKSKAPSQKSFLHMTASEITDDFVRSDVLGECCEVFKSPERGIPLLWSLLSKITSPSNERLVNERQRQQAMAMGILFYTMNHNLRKIQSMIGMVLHNAGVQDSVKQQMCRIGVSIGIHGISAAVKELTARQAKRLLQIGNNVVDKPHTWVYDNLQYQFNVGAERLDNQKSRIDSTAGFVTEAILSKPEMKLPTQASFNLDVLKAMSNTHLLPTSYEDAAFKKEVHKQHLRETVLDVFITPLRPKKGQKSNIKPLDLPSKGPKLTVAQSRCLKSEFKEFTPLQTMPFNEGTIAGTVSWAESTGRQLGLNAKRLEDKVIVAYGKTLRFGGMDVIHVV